MAGESLVPESPEARGQHDRKDLEAINANARELNEEAEDVLGLPGRFWDEASSTA